MPPVLQPETPVEVTSNRKVSFEHGFTASGERMPLQMVDSQCVHVESLVLPCHASDVVGDVAVVLCLLCFQLHQLLRG